MELKDYTIKELKAELKRRAAAKKKALFDDEVRKELIEFINSFKIRTLNSSKVHKYDSWITWIKKQEKQKSNSNNEIADEIINYFQCQSRDEPCRKHIHDKWIAWLESIK